MYITLQSSGRGVFHRAHKLNYTDRFDRRWKGAARTCTYDTAVSDTTSSSESRTSAGTRLLCPTALNAHTQRKGCRTLCPPQLYLLPPAQCPGISDEIRWFCRTALNCSKHCPDCRTLCPPQLCLLPPVKCLGVSESIRWLALSICPKL